MHNLFEYGDILNSPYEAFVFLIQSFMTSLCISTGIIIWKYYICYKDLQVTCDREVYHLNPGDMIFTPLVVPHRSANGILS